LNNVQFSLLKLEEEHDTDFSHSCLAAKFSINSTYIKIIPVDCKHKIANAYLCAMNHVECKAKKKVSEQLDLHFYPIFEDEQFNRIQLKQNRINDIFK
jgi:hypothetical protein